MLDLLFTNPDNTLLEKMAVTPGMVERLSSNIEDLTSFSRAYIDYEKARQNLAANHSESNAGTVGIGTDYSDNSPANPFQNVFPLVSWLMNTPASRKMQGAMNRGAWSVTKKEDGKFYIQLPFTYGTTEPKSTQGECCWVPLDLAKCGSNAPLALLCLKSCEPIMDSLVNETRKIKANDMVCYFQREGETIKEAQKRMDLISMAYFTAINVILGTMATGTATLKPFHGLLEVMEDKAVIKIVGTNVLSAFDSVALRLAALGDGDYKFACHPLVLEGIKSVIVPGKFNGEYPDGWTRNKETGEVAFKGHGFIADKLVPCDITKGTGDVWVLEGNTVGLVMGTTFQPSEKFQRHTFGVTDTPSVGCGAQCDYYYNFGCAFGTDANRLMVIQGIPMSAATLGDTLNGLDLVLKPTTIVPINIGE